MVFKIKSISEVIKNEEEFENFRNAAKEYEVVDKFYEIFPDLKSVAVAKKIEKKCLFLRVENSVWRNELKLNQGLIISKINETLKAEVINKIKFL